MSLPYEILIRSNGGKFSGAHVIETPGAAARAVKAGDWPEIVEGINSALFDRVAELEAEKLIPDEQKKIAVAQAERDAAQKRLDDLITKR